jgi:hypothetical protein
VEATESSSGGFELVLDIQHQQLEAWEHGRKILQAPCSIGHEVRRGTYRVREHRIGGTRLRLHDGFEAFGVPWRTAFGDYDLSGAYWHNRFGMPIPGRSVQVTPLLAQWLYTSLSQHISSVVVI